MSKAGLHVSGNVPFGYRRNGQTKKLEIYEEEAKIVRYIFKLHSEGLGSFKIRDILNAEGYKSATGKAFELPTIKRIIKNPTYKGTIVFNDRKKLKRTASLFTSL
ncbi:recombinase family protein [Bacillus sonorensis]|nr:recombinase family protein [Bacillus sonorensis]